jgi:hypothetical protein
MQSKGDQMSPQKKYVQPNKCTIQRKFSMSNEQQVSEDTYQRKLRPRNKNGLN